MSAAVAWRRWPLTAVLTANAISATGRTLSLIGIPWFVLRTTGSAGSAGVVAFCATLPIVLSALIGGPVIDRIGRRRVSVASDLVCAVSVGAIPLLHHAGALPFWALCALVALHGLAHTPGDTARYVLVPDLAAHAGTTLPRAASLFDAVERGARMAGAALAGLVIALLGAEVALLLDALTFLLSAALTAAGLRGLKAARPVKDMPPVSPRTYVAELREGYACLARTRLLAAVVVMAMLMNGIDQGWNAVLLPVHAERNLGGAAELGLVMAMIGAGGLLGALLYGAVGHRFTRRTVLAVAVLLCGTPRFLVAGLTDSTAALAVVMGGAGLAGGMINPILTTVMYERVPDELRSRVAGAMTAGCELAMPLGGLTAGLLVEGPGLPAALLLMGGAYFLVSLSPLLPVWRGLDAAPSASAAHLSRPEPSRPVPAPSGTTPRPSGS
ncbi:MFS transporter [Streptomyces sp. NBC_01498]|uniref:MFS transporter n=1 Tax=Streptomyces sp. NBC_01498 TaxID=2975870 RepID=UPI002E7B50C5|nr:MFS transporter [Streptomyces sp. NBC_01498]WTL26663.1 MFS transporter [Streptomyces sp. NBC_01498]